MRHAGIHRFKTAPRASRQPFRPTKHELHRRKLAHLEAVLAGLENALAVALTWVAEADRTHTAPVIVNGFVVSPGLPYSVERMRERKAYALGMVRKRRRQIAAARRRVDAARAAVDLPATVVVVRPDKRVPVSPIASAATV